MVTTDPQNGQAVFRSARLFYHSSLDGKYEGWYFDSRDKGCIGPFKDRSSAIIASCDHATYHSKKGDPGGRNEI